jgi:dTDP-4-dehydrorhamnose reductase
LITRTAWLFAAGGVNFPSKILAAADKHGQLRLVHDEWGNPTYAPDAAAAIARLVELGRCGIYHIINSGSASRFEFAQALLQSSGRGHIPLTPVPHTAWPRASQPPLHAVLVNQTAAALGVELRPWQEAVQAYCEHVTATR